MSQGRLTMTYREFVASGADTGALIRPAFQQEVQYDYVPGMEVAFKGLKMVVYRADQSSIQYVVMKGFRDEEVLRQQAKCATWIAMRTTASPIEQPPGCSGRS